MPERNEGDTKPRTRTFVKDALILCGVLAILTLLAHGQIAATVLIMLPMVFLVFGMRPKQ